MYYVSTRNKEDRRTAAEAIAQGLAVDGGLMTPEVFPKLSHNALDTMRDMSYQQRAVYVMNSYLDDFTASELSAYADKAYGGEKFDVKEVAPVRAVDENTYCLELWHGPTCAFKDMALQMLPHLLSASLVKNQEEKTVCILVATSGDTGKAALEGFKDVDKTRILVFYPKDGVSAIQELQMVTQEGKNVGVCSVFGNFDDAQTGVKKIFGDKAFAAALAEKGCQLSSANSINIGRLVPQVVYYVYAYAKLLEAGEIEAGEQINVTVPTGNFGNILAAYLAKEMGVPVKTLICASNENKVLYDFFRTGTYDRNRDFILTTSPSMDILISSNLERLIYLSAGSDAKANAALMKELSEKGSYTVTEEMRGFMKDFLGGFASEEENRATIKKIFEDTGYLIDTHTGVAASVYNHYKEETKDPAKTVIASTASPYKFSGSVLEAIDGVRPEEDEFAIVDRLAELSGVVIPQAVEEIRTAPVRHTAECGIDQMQATVAGILSV